MKAVFLTAGAAGMYCGSCMHDNALAKALRARGVDCLLQPVYTPVRTDDVSIASDQLFFGGIHIYLLQQYPWLRLVPSPLRRLLDWPPLIRLATRRVSSTDPASLAALTISMLQGQAGRQREEVDRLVKWLADEVQPEALLLTNLLIGGALPAIRQALPDTRVLVLLQGDDIFLDHLPEPSRGEAVRHCVELTRHVDRFVVNSRFYAGKMGQLFQLEAERFDVVPLSIDTAPFRRLPEEASEAEAGTPPLSDATANPCPLRIGYLARIAPEKGLHRLVEAFIRLAKRPGNEAVSLHAAGWLGESNRGYLRELTERLAEEGLEDRFVYHGSPDLAGKVRFLHSIDVLSVPTEYEEPKGLFVLEALASGVPVIQPEHGAFPELIASTGGGLLVPPGDVEALCDALDRIARDPDFRKRLCREGFSRVDREHTIQRAAERMERLLTGGALADESPVSVEPEVTPLRDEASVRVR